MTLQPAHKVAFLPAPQAPRSPDFVAVQFPISLAMEADATVHKVATESIRALLDRCAITYPDVAHYDDGGMAARVGSEARRLGIPIDGLAPFIPAGATMASTLYAHLPSEGTRTVICLLTAYFLYIEDLSERDLVSVREFNSRFARGERQRDPTLDGFARVLGELPQHFPPIAANIITTSFLNFVTGTLLEQETQNTTLSKDSTRYAVFVRALTGVSEAYAFFIFPAELPLQSYVQTIPDICDYLGYVNDVISWYKEELAGETVNHVSILAAAQGQTKADVLAALVDTCVAAHERTQRLLASHPVALEAYLAAAVGNIGFHAVNKRYRLQELHL